MNPQWFAKYMSHIANNIVGRDGQVRFSYEQLNRALKEAESDIPLSDSSIRDLITNVLKALPPVALTDRQEVVLILAMLNCHMAYKLVATNDVEELLK